MKKRQIGGLSAAALMALASMAGCAKTADSSSVASTSSGTSSSSQADSDKPVSMRFAWWGSDARHEATLNAIKRYMEINPNVTIEAEYQGYDGYQQKLMTQLAGKTEPDLVQLDYVWFPDLSAQGDFFVDLSSRSEIDLTPYAKDVLDAYCTINDKLIALPMGTNGFGAMINKNFFEKYNIPLDTVWTWESMIEEGKKVHEQDPNAYLFAIESGTSTGGIGPFVLGSYIYSQTGKYWADDASYSIQVGKEDLQKAFTVIKELFDSGAAQPLGEASLFTGQMEQNPKWLNAEMGFTIDWSATIGKYKSAVGEENFTVAQPPFAADGDNQRIAYKPSMVLGISSRSANVDAAANFTNWLLNDKEAVEILGTQRSVPNNQNAFDILNDAGVIDKDVAAMCAFSSSNPAPAVPALQGNTEVADVVKDICEQVIYGKLSPDAAADKFMTDIQEKLDALKASK